MGARTSEMTPQERVKHTQAIRNTLNRMIMRLRLLDDVEYSSKMTFILQDAKVKIKRATASDQLIEELEKLTPDMMTQLQTLLLKELKPKKG
jgi:hypothetical protein